MHVTVHIAENPVFTAPHAATDCLIRGIMDLELLKPTRITSIEVSLIATWSTSWPAGIPPQYEDRTETSTEVSKMDLLYSDKLVMALQNSSRVSLSANGDSTPGSASIGSGSGSASISGTSTPRHHHGHGVFASLASILGSKALAQALGEETGDGSSSAKDGTLLPAGLYTCPFVFTLPRDSAPTIDLPHGSRSYSLKAHVHRPGLLTHSLSCTAPFTVVQLGDERGDEHHGMLMQHEARWRDSLLYAWRLRPACSSLGGGAVGEAGAYVVGETIPLEITFVPLEKAFVHRIGAKLHLMYRARHGSVAESSSHTWDLLAIKQPNQATPLLPILPTSPPNTLSLLTSSASDSAPPAHTDSTDPSTSHHLPDLALAAQLQTLAGPWSLLFHLSLPPSSSSSSAMAVPAYGKSVYPLHFTYDPPPAREEDEDVRVGRREVGERVKVEIRHELVVEVMVSTGTRAKADGKGKGKPAKGDDGKVGDVGVDVDVRSNGDYETIEFKAPVRILSSHCSTASTSLPNYTEIEHPNPSDPYAFLMAHPVPPHGSLARSSTTVSASTSSSSTSVATAMVGKMNIGSAPSASSSTSSLSTAPTVEPPASTSGASVPPYTTTATTYPEPSQRPTSSLDTPPSTGLIEADTLRSKYPNADPKTLENLRRFTALIGGRVGVDGEVPPGYHHVSKV